MTKTDVRTENCPDTLTDAQVAQYHELGYVAFENVLSLAEVAGARDALSEITHAVMDDARSGRARVVASSPNATKNYRGPRVQREGSPFAIHFEDGVDPLALSNEEAELKYRKLHAYHQEHPTFERLVAHPRVQGFMARLLGQEALLKAEMALSKPPFIGSEKPWHQDNAYFNYLPLELVGTVWIALDDATVENGCMHVLPGEHTRGALRHHHTIDCEILPDRIAADKAVPIPLKAGGAMYFSAMLPHQTPPNESPGRRRALQFQYRGVETVEVSKEEFGKAFAEADGRPASCALACENG